MQIMINYANDIPLMQTGLCSWTWQTSTKSQGLPRVHGFKHCWSIQANWAGQSPCVEHLRSNEIITS